MRDFFLFKWTTCSFAAPFYLKINFFVQVKLINPCKIEVKEIAATVINRYRRVVDTPIAIKSDNLAKFVAIDEFYVSQLH